MIPENVAYPTDSGLLAKAVGKMARTIKRVKAAGVATRTMSWDRRRAEARRVREIACRLSNRTKVAREENTPAILRVTGQLLELTEAGINDAAAVVRNGRRGLRRITDGRLRGRCRRALDELEATVQRAIRIADQTQTRLAGVAPQSASRLVSLHDPNARAIRKGRIDHPVEFGYKAQVVDNDGGVILDHSLELGAVADAPQLAPAIARVKKRSGRAPRRRSPPTAATAEPASTTTLNGVPIAAVGRRSLHPGGRWRAGAQSPRGRPDGQGARADRDRCERRGLPGDPRPAKSAAPKTAPVGRAFLRDLVARGLSDVKLVTSDAHGGRVEAIGAALPGTRLQRCRTHYAANLMSVTTKTGAPTLSASLHGHGQRGMAT